MFATAAETSVPRQGGTGGPQTMRGLSCAYTVSVATMPAWVRDSLPHALIIPPLLSAVCRAPACGLARAIRSQSCVQGPCWRGMAACERVASSKDVAHKKLGLRHKPVLAGA